MSALHKFLFEGLPVRGMVVHLTDAWQELLRRHQSAPYPVPVRELLGELAAAATLMHANIKFDGALILQVHGDGPVKLAVAEVQPDLALRATAQVVAPVPEGARLEALVNVQGRGRCAITLDPAGRQPGQQPYQGIVALHGDRREPLQQLDTRLVLAADEQLAAGLLIQRLPVQGQGNLAGGQRDEDDIGVHEDFNRIAHLTATLTRQELLTLDVDTLLRRLYWQEQLRRFEPQAPRFACSCSHERVARMLRGLGREELDAIVAERGNVEIGCEFCGLKYHFDTIDVRGLFTPQADQAPGSPTVQ